MTRFRNIPSKFFELPQELKEYIIQEFQIPENVTKCCSACMVRIRKCIRLQRHIAIFGEDDIFKMKKSIAEHGLNWNILAETFNKPLNVMKLFFILNHKKLNLNECASDYSYNMNLSLVDFSEDDSDISATSSEEREAISSDTASAESPKAPNNDILKVKYIIEKSEKSKEAAGAELLIPPLNQPPKRQKTQEEYDSSATETADEENDVSSVNQLSPKTVQYSFKTLNNAPRDSNVRDIISNVIEKAIKEQSMVLAPPSLKNSTMMDPRSDHSLKRDNFHMLNAKPLDGSTGLQPSTLNKTSNSFAVNILSSNQGPPKPVSNCNIINVDIGCDTHQNSSSFGKPEVDTHTLDLSVKKVNKDMIHQTQLIGYQAYVKSEDIKHTETNQIPLATQNMGSYLAFEQAEKIKLNQSQQCYNSSNMSDVGNNSSNNSNNNISNNSNMRNQGACHTMFSQQKGKMMSKVNSKQMHHSQLSSNKGSITQGIPVSNPQVVNANMMQARLDNIFRQTINSNEKSGSITHGTPMVIGSSPQNVDKRVFEFYNNKSRLSPSNPQQISPQNNANFSSPTFNRAPYMEHPQLSSKQIIMNDYITSQQMIGQHRNSRIEKESVNTRNMNNMPMASSSIYYAEKERSRPEYTNRISPAEHGR